MKLRPNQAEALLDAMVLMTLADARVAEDELTRMVWIHGKLTGAETSEDAVLRAIERNRAEDASIDERLGVIAERLGEAGKRAALRAAFAIASADGRIVSEEDALLVRIAKALDVSPETYRAAVSHMAVAREFL